MEQLFNDLQQQIANKMGNDVSLIDEDYGQLEALQNGEDQYPVTFPCVLIGIPETLWDNLKATSNTARPPSSSGLPSTATMTLTMAAPRNSTQPNAWHWPDA